MGLEHAVLGEGKQARWAVVTVHGTPYFNTEIVTIAG